MRRYWATTALLVLSACGDGGTTDAGLDAAVMDAGGARDAGALDAGTDGGLADAGSTDAGTPDAGPLDAGPLDAGPADGGTALCALPVSAPFTSAGPFENVALTWDGGACGVTSDGADEDVLFVFTNVDGLTGQSFGDWTIDAATEGTILGTNILDEIPADTPVTVTLSLGDATIQLTFTLNASTLTLSAFSLS